VLHTTSHSNPDAESRAIQQAWLADILRQSARVICVSEGVRHSIAGLKDDRDVEVIENASRFRPADCRRAGVEDDGKVIAYVGRTAAAKGADDFFRIAGKLRDTDLRFVCNGVYPDIERFAERAPDNVEFCHSLDADGMLKLYCRCHAVVATYRRSEGLPLALLEALSLGVPVLGYGSPGVADLLARHNQFVVEVGDWQAIAQRIRSWRSDGILFSHPHAEAVPHWSDAAEQYFRVFQDLSR
jgi:glycosyltransferase involved in cell wall biosynthesis